MAVFRADLEKDQINLFDYIKSFEVVKKEEKKEPAPVAVKALSDQLPEKAKALTGKMSFDDFQKAIETLTGKNMVIYKAERYRHYMSGFCEYYIPQRMTAGGRVIMGDEIKTKPEADEIVIKISVDTKKTFGGYLMYATEAGVVYESDLEITFDSGYQRGAYLVRNVNVGKWKKAKLHASKLTTVLNELESKKILASVNPYGMDYLRRSGINIEPIHLLISPQIEQLDKAGYRFVRNGLVSALDAYDDGADIQAFGRLCQPGKNMKEIFKTSKAVYTVLKDCNSISTWDFFRKMDKQGKIDKENIQRVYEANYSKKDLEEISFILGQEYGGKKVFTWDSLQRYLERIDMYEAIDRTEGLLLLRDYLRMCRTLEMKPRIDGDSLKREHDVTARTLRQKADSIRAGKMTGVCEENKKYDYSEHVFFGRCVRSYEDLIDEATQQHNCVASYADSIISKRSFIFVVREMAAPDRSLATVEITPSGEIRQKFLAYNRPIRNKALTEFIDRLADNFKKIRKGAKKAVA